MNRASSLEQFPSSDINIKKTPSSVSSFAQDVREKIFEKIQKDRSPDEDTQNEFYKDLLNSLLKKITSFEKSTPSFQDTKISFQSRSEDDILIRHGENKFYLSSLLPENTEFSKDQRFCFDPHYEDAFDYSVNYPPLKKNQSDILYLFSLFHEIGHAWNWQTPGRYFDNVSEKKLLRSVIEKKIDMVSSEEIKKVFPNLQKIYNIYRKEKKLDNKKLENLFSQFLLENVGSFVSVEKALREIPKIFSLWKSIFRCVYNGHVDIRLLKNHKLLPKNFLLRFLQARLRDERDAWSVAIRYYRTLKKDGIIEKTSPISDHDLLEYAKLNLYSYELSLRLYFFERTKDPCWIKDPSIGRNFLHIGRL